MAEVVSLELIGKTVVENRDELRAFRDEVRAEFRGIRDDQTVMIRMLQRREAEIELMRAIEERYRSLRTKVDQLERRLERAGID